MCANTVCAHSHVNTHSVQAAYTLCKKAGKSIKKEKKREAVTGSLKEALTFRWDRGWSHRVNHWAATLLSESHSVAKTHTNFLPFAHHLFHISFHVFLPSQLSLFIFLSVALNAPLSVCYLLLLSVALSIYISVCACFFMISLVWLCFLCRSASSL